jgi:hypothetical protein
VTELEWGTVLAWITVGVGAVLSAGDLLAVWYFRRQRKALNGNWVYESTWRTVWQITLVCIVLTVNRFLFLAADFAAVWMAVVTGVMAIWLLSIPVRKMVEFVRHEGTDGKEQP